MATRIQHRRGTEGQWAEHNPVLASGEVAYETDTKKMKIGDGSTIYSNLPFKADANPVNGNYRIKSGKDFQIRETAPTAGWRTVWLEGGVLHVGPLDQS